MSNKWIEVTIPTAASYYCDYTNYHLFVAATLELYLTTKHGVSHAIQNT